MDSTVVSANSTALESYLGQLVKFLTEKESDLLPLFLMHLPVLGMFTPSKLKSYLFEDERVHLSTFQNEFHRDPRVTICDIWAGGRRLWPEDIWRQSQYLCSCLPQ